MTIQIWGIATGEGRTLSGSRPRCSFCQRGPEEGRRILIAPEASICQECVESAQAVLEESVTAR